MLGEALVVRVEQSSLRQERMHERVPQRPFDGSAEIRARHQHGVHVHAVRVQRHTVRRNLLVIDRDEDEVDVGLGPHGVVREAAAQDGGEHGLVAFHLLDECVEGDSEILTDVVHWDSLAVERSELQAGRWSLVLVAGRHARHRAQRPS